MSGKIFRIWVIRFASLVPACMLLSACVGGSQALDTVETGTVAGAERQYDGLQLVSYLPPPDHTRNGADVPVATNDLLTIDVFQVDDLDKKVRVDAAGRISLPLIGVVDAAGKTVRDLEAEIARKYGRKYLQDPQVSVFVEESAGQRVTIDGAVKEPGIYPVTSSSTLLQVVAQAGGFDEIADESRLYVFRRVGGRKLVADYDVREIRAGKRRDPRIYGGDVLVSFQSGSKVAVKNLRDALLMASRVGVFVPQ